MFESLSEKLETVFKKLRGEGKITEANVAENLREVRRVLLDADVNYKVAKQFIDDVQKRALGQEVLNSITPGQLIVKIIFDEMTKLLGESKAEIRTSQTPPTVVLIAGLQGRRRFQPNLRATCEVREAIRFWSQQMFIALRQSISSSPSASSWTFRFTPSVVKARSKLRRTPSTMPGKMSGTRSSSTPQVACTSMKR